MTTSRKLDPTRPSMAVSMLLLVLLGLYFAAFYANMRLWGGAIHPVSVDYVVADDISETVFWPAEQFDRLVRPDRYKMWYEQPEILDAIENQR